MPARKTTRRKTTRRRRTTAAPAKRRVTRRRRTGLAAKMTPAKIKGAVLTSAKAGAGGMAAAFLENLDFVKKLNPAYQGAAIFGAAVIVETALGQKEIGLGMAGVAGARLKEALIDNPMGLQEAMPSASAALDSLSNVELLQEGPEYLSEGPEYLSEGIYPDYAPGY